MGAAGPTPLFWAALGWLLLQGFYSQPITTQTSQGVFNGRRLTTEPTWSHTGNQSSSKPGSPSLVSTTSAPGGAQEASRGSPAPPKPVVLSSSTVDGHSPFLLGLTQSQTQRHTSGLGADRGTPHSRSSSTKGVSETSQNATSSSVTASLRTREDLTMVPSPTSETVLTVAAFGVISFIVILVVVVIVLVAVVSLRFKCRKNKESEDPQKPGSSGVSESCSTANGEKDSITLLSVKNINMNNSKGCPSAEKVL
ncbi:endothelial cell-specific chemotaxis regulator isoform X1 [Perognathus longimembris pacificus]|uniref:endothelial cell-specific chemotaxis regulator isoform X1 n=1 Tax=Perognathus longimembris pacificus TaxID=214514 RepID=UPI002018603F|nr:endothelial cell-specific chemotaxis regulator isoform X1 [Perognathus longimembris pacificus]